MSCWDPVSPGLFVERNLQCSTASLGFIMSYSNFNSSSNYYVNPSQQSTQYFYNGGNISYDPYATQAASSSDVVNNDPFHIRNSTLEPTAEEFKPNSQNSLKPGTGAIKKRPQNDKSRSDNTKAGRNLRYGSGRIFNSSRNGYNMRHNSYDERGKPGSMKNLNKDNLTDLRENLEQDGETVSNISQFAHESNKTKSAHSRSQLRNNSNHAFYNQRREFQNDKSNAVSYERGNYEDDINSTSNIKSYKSRDNNSYENYNKNYKSSNKRFEGFDKHKSYDNVRYNEKYEKNSNFYDRKNNCDRYGNSRSKYYNKDEKNNRYDKEDGNWRKKNNKESNNEVTKNSKVKKRLDAASQRERLEEMLNRRTLECLVCCEKIKHTDKVWSCKQCYHILHLKCIIAWAKSSNVENDWRCPACQNIYSEVPHQYKCYCGKTVDPKYEPSSVPHGCGDICLRKGRLCDHKCTILCHPGPCPDCNIMVAKSCGCGSTQQVVKCSADIEIVCDSVCNKDLDCGIHKCKSKCHSGACSPCDEKIIQECYCGKVGRRLKCSAELKGSDKYCCDDVCEKLLSCGNHKCNRTCHEGLCGPCERDVKLVKSCPCGKTRLEKERTSCLDPIPCCDKVCNKKLNCGQPGSLHHCEETCHEGPCPPCPLTTFIRCRCGHMDKEIPCKKLTTKADDARCEKKCTKKRLCGKHRCNQRCCIEVEHFCPLPCNHQLSCGQHRCERTCHSGRCPPCMETSFEELYCECGASVLYPPIRCGTKPPVCSKPCSRTRPCGHDSNHACHTGPCPPCTILCKRWCYGKHEQRSAIPCHQQDFSCGLPCGKPMSCGRHKCVKPCHDGPCPVPCRQPCMIPRAVCGHPCNSPCHSPPCPSTSCKQNVPVTCQCGLQKSTRPCIELAEEYKNIEMAQIKEKMGDFAGDQPVDISDIVSKPRKAAVLKILECNDECRILERNRRLAIGLQIRNPDLSQKLTPKYSDFMRNWAKKDSHFCQKVHDKLTELVQLAKQSKQKSRSYSFESMNRDKRHFIHEYCEHFGCESAAYDMEPNRNIVATAIKEKSWLPSMSLLEVLQRENGHRKVPVPVFGKSSATKSETVTLKLSGRGARPSTPPGEVIDYFNDPPV